MADRPSWSRSSRRLLFLLLVAVVPPAAALAWVATELLRQDRALLAQRLAERQRGAADAAVRSLAREVAEAERGLAGGPVAPGLARVQVVSGQLVVEPAGAPLWWPEPAALAEAGGFTLAEAELWEFQGQPARAVAAYRLASRSPDVRLRAGALVALARMHRAAGRWDAALDAYVELASIHTVAVAATPASLIARRAMLGILRDAQRPAAREAAAAALGRDLLTGRWHLDGPGWELARADVVTAGVPLDEPPDRRAISSALESLWEDWARGATTSRRVFEAGGSFTTVLTNAALPAAVVVPPSALERWRAAAMAAAGVERLELLGPSGQRTGADASARDVTVGSRIGPDETGLPWTLAIGAPDPRAILGELATRRRLLVGSLLSVLALVAGASCFLWRVVHREVAVARLQGDFVAAVSHEFRTPLTALKHVGELLEEDDEVPRHQRRELYGAISRNTDRLHRLVESLLDFGRMEAGRRPYDLRPVEPIAWTAAVVEAFRRDAAPAGFSIELVPEGGVARVLADGPALENALWNLLDNAVKYSRAPAPIRVAVGPHRGGVAITVRDSGLGIPPAERQEIFGRFVRGARARELGIRGTGLGLAMVAHVVAAHGGSIELESEEGAGSSFRIVLPASG